MDKIKLKLQHQDAVILRDHLYDCILTSSDDKTKMGKMFACLFIEAYLKFEAKTLFNYTKQRAFNLTIAQGIAVMNLLQRYQAQNKEDYKEVLFLSIIAVIDQKTA